MLDFKVFKKLYLFYIFLVLSLIVAACSSSNRSQISSNYDDNAPSLTIIPFDDGRQMVIFKKNENTYTSFTGIANNDGGIETVETITVTAPNLGKEVTLGLEPDGSINHFSQKNGDGLTIKRTLDNKLIGIFLRSNGEREVIEVKAPGDPNINSVANNFTSNPENVTSQQVKFYARVLCDGEQFGRSQIDSPIFTQVDAFIDYQLPGGEFIPLYGTRNSSGGIKGVTGIGGSSGLYEFTLPADADAARKQKIEDYYEDGCKEYDRIRTAINEGSLKLVCAAAQTTWLKAVCTLAEISIDNIDPDDETVGPYYWDCKELRELQAKVLDLTEFDKFRVRVFGYNGKIEAFTNQAVREVASIEELNNQSVEVSFPPGSSCGGFEIDGILGDIMIPYNSTVNYSVPWRGNPTFAVSSTLIIEACDPGLTCRGGTVNHAERTNPLPLSIFCRCGGLVCSSKSANVSILLEDSTGEQARSNVFIATCVE